MREKYPTLVFASVSSSGPVQLKENFWEYFDTIHSYGPAHCIQAIESVVTQVDSILFGNDPAKQLELKKTFGLEALEHDDFGVSKYDRENDMALSAFRFNYYCLLSLPYLSIGTC